MNSLSQKIASLKKLREHVSAARTHATQCTREVKSASYSDSEDSGDEEEVAVSVPATSLSAGSIPDKFESSLQLLLESVQEQGRLRCLLEYAGSPDPLRTEINKFQSKETSIAIEQASRLRSAELELARIVDQVDFLHW